MSAVRWSIDAIPERPGVYLFRDRAGGVLYIGKAVNLKARLRSYQRPGADGRLNVAFLDRDAERVETIVTRTEAEALLLEDSLIKQYKPPHNIRLKDDKSFLMLRVDLNEPFPRFRFVRAHRPDEDKAAGRSRYFGPFASARVVRRTLEDLHRVVPLRDCPDSVMNHRSRPCLKHQIGLCTAPCVGLIEAPAYAELVERAMQILGGDIAELEQDLLGRMQRASTALEFERAAEWRDRLAALRRTVENQAVRPKDSVDRDVLAVARRGGRAVVHRLSFREGRLSESRSHRFQTELPDPELLHSVVTALYGGGRRALPSEVVLPWEPDERELLEHALGEGVTWIVPQSGERKRMLELAGENARATLKTFESEAAGDEAALEALIETLDLDPETEVIDCFDISNLQGSHVVASRVRFRRGHADRAGYRRFKVRGVDGQDDFASMHEVVLRSLKRGVREGDLPDLVVIDGGPAQLAKALEARDEAAAFEVRMVGLAKARAERSVGGRRKQASEERVFLPGSEEPIELARFSAARHLLERIRDEAHRFAITYHRKERGRIQSRLDSIPGVGAVKRRALLVRFGSVQGVAGASVEELATVEGISPDLATEILRHLGA
ncbi:MAG: excinuclease ABC subunit UvrC [Planctomycetes bacterium]|nr:excinuclease ABC subunit UvrC [Planctomycetota bacterium]MCB9909273.1 excinuclease ABC subunit UvrC [Planctomycetota bacterium]HPF15373.1 excinuclease ABC subunit UvrC [Planctomycetota bacterium]HRV80864.1 excinuclease ABC subunit UvrC [Planctomycetota bacterium]